MPARPARRVTRYLVGALDVVIAACAVVLAGYVAGGGLVLPFLSVRRLSKPLLVLLVLLSLRAAIRRESWLLKLAATCADRLARLLRGLVPSALSPAACDGVVLFIATLLGTKAVAFMANVLLPQVQARGVPMPFESVRFAETFAAWDSGWYWTIARNGYRYDADSQSSIAFFPLYPMLMRGLAWPFGGTDRALWVAGIVMSLVCFLGALIVLHRLTEWRSGSTECARRTVQQLAVFPFAVFFTHVYTESLFLLLTVSALAAATRGTWVLAGVLGGLATLTRPNGILIAVPLGLMAISGHPPFRDLVRRLAPLTLVPLALVGFCAFAWHLSGDPLAWLHAQDHWGYSIGNRPWVELMRMLDALEREGSYDYFFGHPLAVPYLMHGLVALGFVALTPSVFARLGIPMGAYVATSLLVPLTGNALEGIGRYAATLFPVFMLVGTCTSRRFHEALLILSAMGLALISVLLVTQHKVY